jgi:organic hydroperoxide reductase OsmC/OhrA
MSATRATLVRHGKVRWQPDTPPEELLAVAYSAFIATELAERLELNGVPARELVVRSRCRLSSERTSVEEFEVEVVGRVPGIDEERLRSVARAALASCRRSLRMRRNLRTTLQVSLER